MHTHIRAIIVTGASSGLGAALAKAYAGPQTVLGLIGRHRDRLRAITQACSEAGATVSAATIDVTDAPAMAAWLTEFDQLYTVELLVANAGVSAGPEPESPSEGVAAAAKQIGINLLGGINTIEPLLGAFCSRKRGRIAVVASLAAYRGLPYSPGYCASKAGLRAYAEALRARLEPHGIGVTVICPGFFASPMTDRFDGPTPFLLTAEQATRRVKRGIDRGRRRVVFPRSLAFGLRFCDIAPAMIGDAILRRFRFQIHSS